VPSPKPYDGFSGLSSRSSRNLLPSGVDWKDRESSAFLFKHEESNPEILLLKDRAMESDDTFAGCVGTEQIRVEPIA
jgi:hypothetical protein